MMGMFVSVALIALMTRGVLQQQLIRVGLVVATVIYAVLTDGQRRHHGRGNLCRKHWRDGRHQNLLNRCVYDGSIAGGGAGF